jgi:hypothetical protein
VAALFAAQLQLAVNLGEVFQASGVADDRPQVIAVLRDLVVHGLLVSNTRSSCVA